MTVNDINDLLRKNDIRPTTQRICVYQYLVENHNHPNIDTIYNSLVKQYPSFSRTTIYNCMNVLIEKKLVRELLVEGDFVRYDADVNNHGHFKCEKCGKIFDFPLQKDMTYSQTLNNCKIIKSDVILIGICEDCLKKSMQ